ncbi:MAG: hypothetical protein HY707_02700 [Ignavibacteriae bacterium]|nr:hypothetical protein [Ignavibacteriota bacterium]
MEQLPQKGKKRVGCLVIIGITFLVIIGLIGIFRGVDQFHEVSQKETSVFPLDESNQLSFHSIQAGFPRQYEKAKNEIQKSAIFNTCNKARRDFLIKGNYTVVDWIGTITNIKTDQGGDFAHVEINSNLGGFKVTYMNESLYSIFETTLLKKGTTIYNQVAELTVGQKVRFSGRFIPSEDRGVKEISLTEKGCVDAPEFILSFDEIRKYR